MTQEENESLEDFEERFQLSYKVAYSCTLHDDSLKLVFLQEVRKEYMNTLNLLANGDISQLKYEEIKNIFKNYSRSSSKKGKSTRRPNPKIVKPTTLDIFQFELGTMLEDMKTDILHSLVMPRDIMQLEMEKEEVKKYLAIFCLRCRKSHEKNECPLETTGIYEYVLINMLLKNAHFFLL